MPLSHCTNSRTLPSRADRVTAVGPGDHDQRSTPLDRNGLQILDRDECLRLLGLVTLGRVGVTSSALPVVLPVNFLLEDDRILIRTTRGTKLSAALRNAVVAFEADEIDPIYHTGWSVLVTGTASVIVDPVELERLRSARLARWARAEGDHIVSIRTEVVSGRRLTGM